MFRPREARHFTARARPRQRQELHYSIRLLALPCGSMLLATEGDVASGQTSLQVESSGLLAAFTSLEARAWSAWGPPLGGPRFVARWSHNDSLRMRDLRYGPETLLSWREGDRCSQEPCRVHGQAPRGPLWALALLRSLGDLDAPVDLELALGAQSECYRIRYVGREDRSVPAGHFAQARHFAITVHPIHTLGEDQLLGPVRSHYDVWISADEEGLPLEMRRKLPVGSLALLLTTVELSDADPGVLALALVPPRE